MSIYKRALELKDEMIKVRRQLHKNPELGMELPNTIAYLKEKLLEMGYHPADSGQSGLTATVGSGEKTVLLRADMDALPILEDSGLGFASKNGNTHACGHDLHTTCLLFAAKLLKENESRLKGKVKLMFQPGEEVGKGALSMIEDNILENPKVDIAISSHVTTRATPENVFITSGPAMASSDGFYIEITGKGGHGSAPSFAVDPINIGVHIHLALQEILSKEIDFNSRVSLTIGTFNSGSAQNIIPQTAQLSGTIRTLDAEDRAFVKKRLVEMVDSVAKTYRGTAKVFFNYGIPTSVNNPIVTEDVKRYISSIDDLKINIENAPPASGSEDFSYILEKVPGMMFFLGAGFDESSEYENLPNHHPKVTFNEDALPIGATLFTEISIKWLEEN